MIKCNIVGLLAIIATLTVPPAFVAGCSNNDTSLYEQLAASDAPKLDSKGGAESVVQKGGILFVDGTECGPIKEWMATDGGCTPRPQQSIDGVQFSSMNGALEMDGSFDLSMDCSGNCGPAGVHWCCTGNACTSKGFQYQDRYVCVPILDEAGKCHMKAIAYACPSGQFCELTGSYPTWAQCLSCKSNADCEDDNVCTDDACSPMTGQCSHVNNVATCDDGNLCNGIEKCGAGVCKGGTLPNCDDGNLCTNDSCVNATGCVNASNTLACDDNSACTVGDKCQDGACQPGTNPDCGDANPCTVDTCDATLGCQHANVANTTVCNDAKLCTVNDECTDGKCGGAAKSCDDANPCTMDACDPLTGACTNVSVVNGTTCGADKQCVSGTCYAVADTCTVKGAGTCKQPGGILGHYTCVMATGATIGIWTLDEVCGAVELKLVCADDTGCANANSVEANCEDGLDNDGDGKADCEDADCALKSVCGACIVDADCIDDGNLCTAPVCELGLCSLITIAGCCTADAGCPAGKVCSATYTCVAPCVPVCTGKACGNNGCGGSCGTCAAGTSCSATGVCVAPCVPSCTGKVCGDDGCGGTCGTCAVGQACNSGTCAAAAGDGIGFVAKAADADVHCWDESGNHIGKFAVVSGDSFNCPNAANGSPAVAVTTTVAACGSCLNAGLAYGACKNLSGGGYGCQK